MTQLSENPVFRALDEKGEGVVETQSLFEALEVNGICESDQRLGSFARQVAESASGGRLDGETFESLSGSGKALLERAVRKDFIVPDFAEFRDHIFKSFQQIAKNQEGEAASYIPQLARVNPDQFAVFRLHD